MQSIVLNLAACDNRKALHEYLQQALEFPAYYGKNLDALYDMLISESRELRLTVCYPIHPAEDMEMYFERLLRVFDDARMENDRLQIVWRPVA